MTARDGAVQNYFDMINTCQATAGQASTPTIRSANQPRGGQLMTANRESIR